MSSVRETPVMGKIIPRIAVRHLGKRFESGTVALDDVSFDVADGEFVSIVGPSGCGKTTLLRIIAGLESASCGDFAVAADTASLFTSLPAAVVFQEQSLMPWLTVRANVEIAFDRLRGVSPAERRRRTNEQLAAVGLIAFADAYPHQLSGGMKQRTAVARAFAVEPRVLYMDEPFGALDEQTRAEVGNVLLRLWETSRKTVLFITHGIEEAVALSDRVIVLSSNPGRIREIVPVDLPRPRDIVDLRGDPRFGELVVHIWNLLRSEPR
jgi:NitT/TauT family transport system ATP-binding protein